MTIGKRLRVLKVTIQPTLVWDDGEEFSPGPEVPPIEMPVSAIADYVASIPDGLNALQGDAES